MTLCGKLRQKFGQIASLSTNAYMPRRQFEQCVSESGRMDAESARLSPRPNCTYSPYGAFLPWSSVGYSKQNPGDVGVESTSVLPMRCALGSGKYLDGAVGHRSSTKGSHSRQDHENMPHAALGDGGTSFGTVNETDCGLAVRLFTRRAQSLPSVEHPPGLDALVHGNGLPLTAGCECMRSRNCLIAAACLSNSASFCSKSISNGPSCRPCGAVSAQLANTSVSRTHCDWGAAVLGFGGASIWALSEPSHAPFPNACLPNELRP